jgi:hypothetical protein
VPGPLCAWLSCTSATLAAALVPTPVPTPITTPVPTLAAFGQSTPTEPTRVAVAVPATTVERPLAPAREPDRSEDARWALWSRIRHGQNLSFGTHDSLEVADSTEGVAAPDPSALQLDEDAWPFAGQAPTPRLITGLDSPSPTASAEWRRRGGNLAASFSMGAMEHLAECHRAMEALQAAIAKSSRTAAPGSVPHPDWTRDPRIPAKCPDAVGYLELDGTDDGDRGEERDAWASAWADSYPIGDSQLRLVIATDPMSDTSLVAVFGLGADGSGHTYSETIGGMWGYGFPTSGVCFLHADFDANGTPDYFIATWGVSNGICIKGHGGVFVLSDAKRRVARITPFDGDNMEFIDHDGNGRAEILLRELEGVDKCLDGRPHNFWVTRLLGFQDLGVVDLRDVDVIRNGDFVGRFPCIEWFSHDPRDRFRPLLDDKQRRKIGESGFPLYRKGAKTAIKPTQPTR